MVEMVETATILNQAGPRSLVILDEVGRGTSTLDGLSLAWAISEEIHNKTDISSLCLFATHYHELTNLSLSKERVRNFNFSVKEWQGDVIFLRTLKEGAASRSYGIQVASLAGLPNELLTRAKEILRNLEGEELNEWGRPRLAGDGSSEDTSQLMLFAPQDGRLRDELRAIDTIFLCDLNPSNARSLEMTLNEYETHVISNSYMKSMNLGYIRNHHFLTKTEVIGSDRDDKSRFYNNVKSLIDNDPDLVLITAGVQGQRTDAAGNTYVDRQWAAEFNSGIIRELAKYFNHYNGTTIILTNPCDSLNDLFMHSGKVNIAKCAGFDHVDYIRIPKLLNPKARQLLDGNILKVTVPIVGFHTQFEGNEESLFSKGISGMVFASKNLGLVEYTGLASNTDISKILDNLAEEHKEHAQELIKTWKNVYEDTTLGIIEILKAFVNHEDEVLLSTYQKLSEFESFKSFCNKIGNDFGISMGALHRFNPNGELERFPENLMRKLGASVELI